VPTEVATVPGTGARVLLVTVEELSRRAPAIVAAAAAELGQVVLGLHFGDGTQATLRAQRSRLVATSADPATGPPDVEVFFDTRAMNLVFDLAGRPVDQLLPGSLDVRGPRPAVLAGRSRSCGVASGRTPRSCGVPRRTAPRHRRSGALGWQPLA